MAHPRIENRSEAPPTLTAAILAFAVSALSWALVGSTPVTEQQVWSIGLIWLGVFSLTFGALDGRVGPMILMFWPFVIVSMGIAPMAQEKLQIYPRLDPSLQSYYPQAQLLVLAATSVYTIAYFYRSTSSANDVERIKILNHSLGGSRRLAMALGLAVLSFPLSLASGTGLGSRFQSRDDLISAYSEAGISYSGGQSIQLALLKMLPTVLAIVATLLSTYEVRRRRRERASLTNAVATLVVSAAAFTVFANPISNNRYTAFSAILAVMFCALRFSSKGSRLGLAAALVFGLIAVYPAAATFKNATADERIQSGISTFTTVDFDSMQQTANAFYYVESRGHTYGQITASAAFFFVPRQLWNEKLLPSSYLTTEARGYGSLNLSQPLWSELYIDFGWLGALLLFGLVGWGSARLDSLFNSAPNSPWIILVAAASSLQVGLLRGPMGAIMIYTATTILLAAIIVTYSTRRRRRPAALLLDSPRV